MLAVLGRILQGPPIPIIAGLIALQVLSAHVPFLLFGILFAGIAAAFLVLTRPLQEAARIVLWSGLGYTLISYLLTLDPSVILTPILFLGAPSLLAGALRRSESLALTILGGFAIGWVLAKILELLPTGLDDIWARELESAFRTARETGQAAPFPDLPMELLHLISTELVLSSIVLLTVLLLLLARTWQSAIAAAPFFAAEFRSIRFGRFVDLGFLLLVAATVGTLQTIGAHAFFLGLSLTFAAAFLFPGIATVHRLSDRIRYPLAVLLPFYILFLIRIEMVLAVIALGAVADLIGWSRQTREIDRTP